LLFTIEAWIPGREAGENSQANS